MPSNIKPRIPYRASPEPSARFSAGVAGQHPSGINALNLAKGLYGLMGLKLAPGNRLSAFERGRFNLPIGEYGIHGKYENIGRPTDYWNLGVSIPFDSSEIFETAHSAIDRLISYASISNLSKNAK